MTDYRTTRGAALQGCRLGTGDLDNGVRFGKNLSKDDGIKDLNIYGKPVQSGDKLSFIS